MAPHNQFCPNPDCPAYGQVDAGNIRVHNCKEQRYAAAASAGKPLPALMVPRAIGSITIRGCLAG